MQCNIDARGKRVRLVSGLTTVVVSLGLLILTAAAVLPWWGYLVGGIALIGGAFQVYEARAGWCAVRAMGFKTPL